MVLHLGQAAADSILSGLKRAANKKKRDGEKGNKDKEEKAGNPAGKKGRRSK